MISDMTFTKTTVVKVLEEHEHLPVLCQGGEKEFVVHSILLLTFGSPTIPFDFKNVVNF
jgi:hypothetical protein